MRSWLLITVSAMIPIAVWAQPPAADKCLNLPPANHVEKGKGGFIDVKSTPAGLLIASGEGLLQGDKHVALIEPNIGTVWAIAVSEDRQEVAAVGRGRMLRSHEGGHSFAIVPLPDDQAFFAAAFLRKQLFVFSTSGRAFRLDVDGSAHELSLPTKVSWIAAAFTPRGVGFVVGMCNALLVTEDAGATWVERHALAGAQGLFLSGEAVFVGGQGGLYRSNDRGQSFAKVLEAPQCFRGEALNGAIAIACQTQAPRFDTGLWFAHDGVHFKPVSPDWRPFFFAATLEPDETIAGVTVQRVLVRGVPGAMKIIYESPEALQGSQRLRRAAESKSHETPPGKASPPPVTNPDPSRPKAPPELAPSKRHALTDQEQQAFLRSTSSMFLKGSFHVIVSTLFTVGVNIETTSARIKQVAFKDTLGANAAPTWRQYFDEFARQAHASWHYEAEHEAWVFESLRTPLPYHLDLAKGWRVDDRGDAVMYVPPDAPIGMDIYLSGRYEPPLKPEEQRERRDAIALKMAAEFKPGVTVRDMEEVEVDGVAARYFEAPTPRPGVTWRQWAFVKNGQPFLIVSAIAQAQESVLLPQVKGMVESFRVIEHD
jgi:hypothetical protein